MMMGLTKGDLLEGRYRILHRIGEGGMGVVYAAEHVVLHKKCAIKVLHPSEAEDETMIRRFKIEAQAAANIRHANIVEVMDFGITPDERPFFVMEYLEGESLAGRIDSRGKMSEQDAVAIAVQILSGLSAAHRVRVVHRDLKPENIFLTSAAQATPIVKILDFGISKIVTGTPSMPPAPVSGDHRALTQKGVIFGTPGYMAPETLFGTEPVDSRSDLFSVAVLLFEMVTGEQPFRAYDAQSTMLATLSRPSPKPTDIAPTISKDLELVILKGLSKEPLDRFQTADEFLKKLIATSTLRYKAPARGGHASPFIPASGHQERAAEDPIPFIDKGFGTLFLDESYLKAPGLPERPPRDRRAPSVKKPPGFRAKLQRISIAFSPIPVLFFLGLGGAVYYYFIHNHPMRTIAGHEDPIDQKIADRTNALTPGHHNGSGASDGSRMPIETVAIWIESTPKDVSVRLDGKDIYERPLIVPKSFEPIEMQLTAPGYDEAVHRIVPDQEQTVTVRLKRVKREHVSKTKK